MRISKLPVINLSVDGGTVPKRSNQCAPYTLKNIITETNSIGDLDLWPWASPESESQFPIHLERQNNNTSPGIIIPVLALKSHGEDQDEIK